MCLFLHFYYGILGWGDTMKKTHVSIVIKFILVCSIIWYIPNKQLDQSLVIEAGTRVSVPSNNQSIYIYNTHQSEAYVDYDVIEASYYLQNLLVDDGYYCEMMYEDLDGYRFELDIDYTECYTVSRMFVEPKVQDKGYDLVIDLHRDALTKDLSTIHYEGKDYAKIMFVVGKGSDHYEESNALANTLSDIAEERIPGISRGVFLKESDYNQDMTHNMILLELGANENTKEDVQNSVLVFKEIIEIYLNSL